MLVRFTSKSSAHVSMFEKDAELMLRMMKRSGNIPSALAPDDIARSLEALEHALNLDAEEAAENGGEEDNNVSMGTRAFPLIELLKNAQAKQEHVMWEYDKSVF